MRRHLDLHFWHDTRRASSFSAGLSAVVHAGLIAAMVAASQHSAEMAPQKYELLARYFPPPDPEPREQGSAGARETVRYVALAPEGEGSGTGPAVLQADQPAATEVSETIGNEGEDLESAPAQVSMDGDDVFTIIEVDTEAARLPESAAPRYPRVLLDQNIEGRAIVQFVVDTTGFADSASFRVVLASHQEFVQSIREALPDMRFSTARIGAMKVRQLVEMPFNFRIVPPAADAGTAATGRRPPE